MKCDDCINLLEAYIDGEAGERNVEQVRAHLLKCQSCTREFELLAAESELYAHYDRELQISPAVWSGIAARIATKSLADDSRAPRNGSGWLAGLFAMPRFGFAFSAAALVLIAVFVGLAYFRAHRSSPQPPDYVANNDKSNGEKTPKEPDRVFPVEVGTKQPNQVNPPRPIEAGFHKPSPVNRRNSNHGDDVLFRDAAFTDIEDKDTASHLEQAQNLLISVRSIQLSEEDQEVDVSYEKAESRRLLNENIVLRRDAEMAGKFPAKSMLGSLEPFLIDIANLPDKAPAKDLRQIRDRVEKTEIVAELRGYE